VEAVTDELTTAERLEAMAARRPAAEAADQVPRLKAWLAAHPAFRIRVLGGMWRCESPAADSLAVACDLGILLDRLEAAVPVPRPAGAGDG
jgi:hypothetical protein